MPSLAAQAVKLSSLAGALLLSTGLIIHLHLLHSKSLPSTVATYSRPAPSTLLSHGAGAGASERPAQIEFSVAGLYVDLEDALNIDYPLQEQERHAESLFLQPGSPASIASSPAVSRKGAIGEKRARSGLSGLFSRGRRKVSASRLKILIAVTSECCSNSSKSALRRTEARKTWARYIWDKHSDAHIRFVLAQPPASARAGAVVDLREEASASKDLLVIRGLEDYKNLPNKSLRLMRYALSSPAGYMHVLKTDDNCYIRYSALAATLQQPQVGEEARKGYTHVLKTDDDCYIRYPALAAALQQPQLGEGAEKGSAAPQMSGVYKGCLENPHGFYALRNADSKWHIPYEDMPDWVVPWKRKYLAGWGYLLSRDVVQHIVNTTLLWERLPDQAPGWYAGLHWEDVLVGLVVSDYTGEEPQDNEAFVAAWKGCSSGTAVRHLDVEAPELFQELYRMEQRGEWTEDEVRCSRGEYGVGDYWSWKGWRDSLTGVQALGDVGRH